MDSFLEVPFWHLVGAFREICTFSRMIGKLVKIGNSGGLPLGEFRIARYPLKDQGIWI